MRLSEGAPHDGEILRVDVHQTAGDRSGPDHHAVTVKLLLLHPELGHLVGDEHLEFHETARIEQLVDPLPGAELAPLVLLVDLLLTAAQARQGLLRLQLFILLFQDSNPPFIRVFLKHSIRMRRKAPAPESGPFYVSDGTAPPVCRRKIGALSSFPYIHGFLFKQTNFEDRIPQKKS